MDIFLPIIIIIFFCIVFSICGWCCKRKQEGVVYSRSTPVTVTSTHITQSPVVQLPYPIDARHPVPQTYSSPAPGIGFSSQTPYPPTTVGYPPAAPPGFAFTPGIICYPSAGGDAPYPPTTGAHYPPTNSTPYPPASGNAPYPPASMPPSYAEAVNQPPSYPPNNEGYVKQSPYNPNF